MHYYSKILKITSEIFCTRLSQANLTTKTDFDTKLISLDKKLTQIKQTIYSLKTN